MDCITTYCDDSMGHNDGQIHLKPNEFSNPHDMYNDVLYGCGINRPENISIKSTGQLQGDSHEWSRLGPMGYLVKPKLYSINVPLTSAIPINNTDMTRNSQKLINDKCFTSVNIVPVSPFPPVDILRRINDDRLRSTYQIDFGHMDDYPWIDYDNLLISNGYKASFTSKQSSDEIKCRESVKLPSLNGHSIPGHHSKGISVFESIDHGGSKVKRQSVESVGPKRQLKPVRRQRVSRQSQNMDNDNNKIDSHIYKNDKETGRADKHTKGSRKDIAQNLNQTGENNDELQLIQSLPGTSEYQDIISRTADQILQSKLHYYGKIRLVTPNPECP